MSPKLPNGLIEPSRTYQSGERDSHPVPLADILRLWRAYSASKHAIEDSVGIRLECLFWRISGSPELQESLSGSRIAYLHWRISQNKDIRNAIQQPPTKSSFEGPDNILVRSRPSQNDLDRTHRVDMANSFNRAGRDRSSSRPRPILKTPGIDAITPGKSARILTPTWGQDAKGKALLKAATNDPKARSNKAGPSNLHVSQGSSTSKAESIRPSSVEFEEASDSPTENNSIKAGKRTPSFTVASKKRRPAMPRRRSSATTGTGKSPKTSTPPAANTAHHQEYTRSQSHGETGTEEASDLKTISEVPNTSQSLPMGTRSASSAQSGSNRGPRLSGLSFLNPQMRTLSAKSASATGLTLTTPISANLEPFSDASAITSGDKPVQESQKATAGLESQSGSETLVRSRSNLNLLLQKEKRREDGNERNRRR